MLSDGLVGLSTRAKELSSVIGRFPFLSFLHLEINNIIKKLDSREVIIPLVGEFSSGKSSLVNALIGKSILPVDITPTTFVVNEVRFSRSKDRIEIYYNDGTVKTFENLISLSQIDYSNASEVKVYTTSSKLPSNIVLVDLPGISSDISRHTEVTLKYLPNAQCLFVVIDINQGTITKSLEDFLVQAKVVDLPIYAILTKSDLKSPGEIIEVVNYFKYNPKFKKVITTSAKAGQVEDLISLCFEISAEAEKLLFDRLRKEIDVYCKYAVGYLQAQLSDLKLDFSEIEKKAEEVKADIDKYKKEAEERLVEIDEVIDEVKAKTVDKFKGNLLGKSNSLVDAVYDPTANFKEKFEDSVRSAMEEALYFFRKEIEIRLNEKVSETRVSIDNDIRDISTPFKYFNFAVSSMILNFILPGGIIVGLLSQTVLTILQERFKGGFFGIINKFVGSIATFISEKLTRKYTKGKIEELINNIVSAFDNKLAENCELIKRELRSKIEKELKNIINDLENKYKELLNYREKEKEQIELYRNSIEEAIVKINNLCVSQ